MSRYRPTEIVLQGPFAGRYKPFAMNKLAEFRRTPGPRQAWFKIGNALIRVLKLQNVEKVWIIAGSGFESMWATHQNNFATVTSGTVGIALNRGEFLDPPRPFAEQVKASVPLQVPGTYSVVTLSFENREALIRKFFAYGLHQAALFELSQLITDRGGVLLDLPDSVAHGFSVNPVPVTALVGNDFGLHTGLSFIHKIGATKTNVGTDVVFGINHPFLYVPGEEILSSIDRKYSGDPTIVGSTFQSLNLFVFSINKLFAALRTASKLLSRDDYDVLHVPDDFPESEYEAVSPIVGGSEEQGKPVYGIERVGEYGGTNYAYASRISELIGEKSVYIETGVFRGNSLSGYDNAGYAYGYCIREILRHKDGIPGVPYFIGFLGEDSQTHTSVADASSIFIRSLERQYTYEGIPGEEGSGFVRVDRQLDFPGWGSSITPETQWFVERKIIVDTQIPLESQGTAEVIITKVPEAIPTYISERLRVPLRANAITYDHLSDNDAVSIISPEGAGLRFYFFGVTERPLAGSLDYNTQSSRSAMDMYIKAINTLPEDRIDFEENVVAVLQPLRDAGTISDANLGRGLYGNRILLKDREISFIAFYDQFGDPETASVYVYEGQVLQFQRVYDAADVTASIGKQDVWIENNIGPHLHAPWTWNKTGAYEWTGGSTMQLLALGDGETLGSPEPYNRGIEDSKSVRAFYRRLGPKEIIYIWSITGVDLNAPHMRAIEVEDLKPGESEDNEAFTGICIVETTLSNQSLNKVQINPDTVVTHTIMYNNLIQDTEEAPALDSVAQIFSDTEFGARVYILTSREISF